MIGRDRLGDKRPDIARWQGEQGVWNHNDSRSVDLGMRLHIADEQTSQIVDSHLDALRQAVGNTGEHLPQHFARIRNRDRISLDPDKGTIPASMLQ